MKIIYIKLVNFADVYAAMGKHEVEFRFDKIDKPIIQIYGRNRCGKTVLIQKLHPFSSINLNGDERNDVPLILKGKTGIKNIVYEMDGEVYNITHTYTPTKNGHSVNSSMIHNEVEMNTGGGVNTFNALIESVFGINRYVFQFIINGTQLTSFANMNATQRKNLMNKAMGIDIYDKIHKLATDDYRYTSKLIASLTRTKEFLLQNYGSYETLRTTLEQTRLEHDAIVKQMQHVKTRIDQLAGVIISLRNEDLAHEETILEQKLVTYKNVVDEFGQFDPDMYEHLMEEQLHFNEEIHKVSSQRMLLMKDLDILYEKKTNVENDRLQNQRIISDYQNMLNMRDRLEQQIRDMIIEMDVETPVSTLTNMLSIASTLNEMCKEIFASLSQRHLEMFCDMVLNNIDIAGFLIQENSVLMDSEKERNTVSRIRHMLNTIDGDIVDEKDCRYGNCLYRKAYEMLSQYFVSYESATDHQYTQYDLDQLEHSLKNLQTMQRLLRIEIPIELQKEMEIKSIFYRLKNGLTGIDIDYIKRLMENAAKMEMRKKYIQQLTDMNTRISDMEKVLSTQHTNADDVVPILQKEIDQLRQQISECERLASEYKDQLSMLDRKKTAISSIRNINIRETQLRYDQIKHKQNELMTAKEQQQQLNGQYYELTHRVQLIESQLETLENADRQYVSTVDEIERHLTMDQRYKIISEATSSTKGKPVIAIRDTITEALTMANRLLDVMYDGEIELLRPTINETVFTLPFRCGTNRSEDIRTGSQSESTLLSLALSLSLAYCLTGKFVPLVDEIDAYIDSAMRDVFVLMLQEIMSTLKLEQMFLISHSILPNQYSHIVHTIDISK